MIAREWRELSFIPRWGILRRVRDQSVAEHSYYVATYVMLLGGRMGLHNDIINEAIKLALTHDIEEIITGDIPAPAKKYLDPEGNKVLSLKSRAYSTLEIRHRGVVNPVSVYLVKLADLMDGLAYLATEIQMGNGSVSVVLQEMRIRTELLLEEMDKENALGAWNLPSMMSMIHNFIEEHRNNLSDTLVHPAARGANGL